MKIIQNTLKIEAKFSDVQTNFRESPKKVGLVGFWKRDMFFFWPHSRFFMLINKTSKKPCAEDF